MSIPATKLKERFGDSRKRRPNKLETKPSRLHRTLTSAMPNDDRSIRLIFNGEIFNHVELRQTLKAKGHVFHTSSDTEVILRLYEDKGLDCVDDLNGDFSFAIWDEPQRRLMVARDRMGVRPLFYTQRDGCLYFASEVKALLQAPDIEAQLDPLALDQIFTMWFPLTPRTGSSPKCAG